MDEWINLTEQNWVLWVAGLFALFEFFKWFWSALEWIISKFGIETITMRTKREMNERLKKAESDIVEIKETAKANVTMFIEHEKKVVDYFDSIKDEVIVQLNSLNDKFDEQQSQLEDKLETIDTDGKRRDVAVMRDRILSGLRYFSQNKDLNGVVHISMTDFENMNSLITEYLDAGGNGVVKHIYENDFQTYKIDNTSFDTRK